MGLDTDGMADGLRKMFMAGVGMVAAVGERGGAVVESLAERGESVVKQGRDLNRELTQKGAQAASGIREDVLRGMLRALSAHDRGEFLARAQAIVEELDARDASRAAATQERRASEASHITIPVDVVSPDGPAPDDGGACCGR